MLQMNEYNNLLVIIAQPTMAHLTTKMAKHLYAESQVKTSLKTTLVTSSMKSHGCPGPPSNDERFRPCSNTALRAGHNLSVFTTNQSCNYLYTPLTHSVHLQEMTVE